VHEAPSFFGSALAGALGVLPPNAQIAARYAGVVKCLQQEQHLSGKMMSVQAIIKKKGVALWQKVYHIQSGCASIT